MPAEKKELTVREQFDALVQAVARENGVTVGTDVTPILSVSIANDTVSVVYVDRPAVSAFEPDPIRTIRSKV